MEKEKEKEMEMGKGKTKSNQKEEDNAQVEIREGYQPSDILDTSKPPNCQQQETPKE